MSVRKLHGVVVSTEDFKSFSLSSSLSGADFFWVGAVNLKYRSSFNYLDTN